MEEEGRRRKMKNRKKRRLPPEVDFSSIAAAVSRHLFARPIQKHPFINPNILLAIQAANNLLLLATNLKSEKLKQPTD
jgi:hypothetical protein